MRALMMAAAAILALGACSKTPADNQADQLDNAAEQSDPAAAATLRERADELRSEEPANANAAAQDALDAAGRAQTGRPSER